MLLSRDYSRPLIVALSVSALAALGFFVGGFNTWSARVSDRFFLPRSVDARIALIAIDDASLGQIGRWPWPRRVHAELISKLSAAGASIIGYDVNFPEPSDPVDDQELAAALKLAGNVVLPVELELNLSRGSLSFKPKTVLSPIPALSSAAAATGHTNTPPDVDGVVRRIPLAVSAPDGSSLRAFVAESLRLMGLDRRLHEAPVDALGQLVINFPNQPTRAFHTFSAADVIRGAVNLTSLKNAIVLVGATAPDLHDALLVPTSYGQPMSGIEIHASSLDTLLQRRWLKPVPATAVVGWIMFLGLGLGCLLPLLRARWSAPLAILLWILTVMGAFFLFDRGWIMDLVWPTLVIIFTYSAVTLERRITADRQRHQLKQMLSQYVSATVVEAILKDPTLLKLGGERRRMSVLFSDIRGFTSISEGMSPEKLVSLLNVYLGRMTDLVFAHNGVLDKYIGDAVMAFWNAPLDQPEHAKMAVTTALDMRDALLEMNRAKAFSDPSTQLGMSLELHIGLGVNTGDMVVGNVGGESRFDYTVIGDNVNLASRLEGLTKEYHVDVLVTEATQRELVGAILTRKLDKVAVKGKNEPIIIYEAMERLTSAGESQKALARKFEAALEAYFRRDFQDAVTQCEALLVAYPNDGPAMTLFERAKYFIKTPPPADWDGTWVYTKK